MIDLPTPPVQYAPPAAPTGPAETIYIVADSANLFSGAQMIDGKRNMDIKVNLATTLPLVSPHTMVAWLGECARGRLEGGC